MRKSVLAAWVVVSTLALSTATANFDRADAQATSSVKCSDGTVTVSSGNSTGTCVKNGQVITCGQGDVDQAGGGCDSNGKANCGNTRGNGSCTIAQITGAKPKVKVAPGVLQDGTKQNTPNQRQ